MSMVTEPVITDVTGQKIVDAIKARDDLVEQVGKIKDDLAGVAGGDAWTQRTYTSGEVCIYNNKAWECVADTTSAPSAEDTGHWKQISLRTINRDLSELKGRATHIGVFNQRIGGIAVTNLENGIYYSDGISYTELPENATPISIVPYGNFSNGVYVSQMTERYFTLTSYEPLTIIENRDVRIYYAIKA